MDVNRRDVIGGAVAIAALYPLASNASADEASAGVADLGPVPDWYMREPLRVSWHLMRDIDGGKSGAEVVEGAVANNVNAITFTVGGSYAFYPSEVPFHERSNALAPGRDMVGEVATAARAHGVRLFARFDFSKQSPDTFRAHPEWFYKRADGSYSESQGRYRPCLNAGFYRETAPAIVAEVVQRYSPSLIYFNNFSNTSNSREQVPCVCASCTSAWAQKRPGAPFPTTLTPDYLSFMNDEAQITASLIEAPIRRQYPDVVILNANVEPSDGLHLESRMVYPNAQMWPYETTEATDRQITSKPGKIGLNLCISYTTNFSRMTMMPPPEVKVRMYQAIAAGSNPAFAMTGVFDQYDRPSLAAAKHVFDWHKRNEDLYVGQKNAARILMLCRPSVRARTREAAAQASENGLYQILAEHHVPVAVSETSAPLLQRAGDFDLLLISRGAPLDGVEDYVRNGGAAIFVDQHPGFAVGQPLGTQPAQFNAGYWRVRDASQMPGFPSIDFIQAGGGWADTAQPTLQLYPAEQNSALTYVPPMLEDPAEQAASNLLDTDAPGLIWRTHGAGRFAFLPWDVGGLYSRIYLSSHAQVLMGVLRGLRPDLKQIDTDAAPSVQMMLMAQPARERQLLHLINLSGQNVRGFNAPTTTGPIRINLQGDFSRVDSRALGRRLSARRRDGRTEIALPSLSEFDSLVFS